MRHITFLLFGICIFSETELATSFSAPHANIVTGRFVVPGTTISLAKPSPPWRSGSDGVKLSAATIGRAPIASNSDEPGIWPCFDELDKRLIKISIPMIINFAITPLVGANDLFWTNRMGNALAVAGMAAANQVYNTGFWLASFLPSVTATIVGKENAKKNEEGVQDAVCQALFVATMIAIIGTSLYARYPAKALGSILGKGAPAMEFARPYLNIRSLAFLPGLISLVGFSAFRGTLDVKTPFAISVFSNFLNFVLNPILMFPCAMGVSGCALSTLIAEVVSAVTFLVLLMKRKLIKLNKIFRLPKWSVLSPLIKGGLALQLRMVAFNITFMAVARVTQSLDKTGVAAAAHEMALQTFQLGGVVLMALSVVAQSIIPNELYGENGPKKARCASNRMMSWGLILGGLLGALQLAALPVIMKTTPMQDVRAAAHAPATLASVLQLINGLVFIGEGVMSGCGDFMFLAISTLIATGGCLGALSIFPQKYGVAGVWMGFAVFNFFRLAGVSIHQFVWSKIAPRNLNKSNDSTSAGWRICKKKIESMKI